jgi:hypothetical protein
VPAGGYLKRSAPLLASLTGLVVAAGFVYATTEAPHIRHTSALNTVFDTRWLVAAGRLLAVTVIAYLLASIAVRVTRGQWVRSAGSLTTDVAATRAITEDQRELQQRLREADQTIDALKANLARSLEDRRALLARMEGHEQRGDEHHA